MLRSMTEMLGLRLRAEDGDLGTVCDFYFDSSIWTARYLLADTSSWLPGRKVLVPPGALSFGAGSRQAVPVGVARDAVRNSPDFDETRPPGRSFEIDLHDHFGWRPYWTPPALQPVSGALTPGPEHVAHVSAARNPSPLRCLSELTGSPVHATDGGVGSLQDLIVDDTTWMLRYAVVNASEIRRGRTVLLSLSWADGIAEPEQALQLNLTRRKIAASPQWNPELPLDRDYEEQLHQHYEQARYWV